MRISQFIQALDLKGVEQHKPLPKTVKTKADALVDQTLDSLEELSQLADRVVGMDGREATPAQKAFASAVSRSHNYLVSALGHLQRM